MSESRHLATLFTRYPPWHRVNSRLVAKPERFLLVPHLLKKVLIWESERRCKRCSSRVVFGLCSSRYLRDWHDWTAYAFRRSSYAGCLAGVLNCAASLNSRWSCCCQTVAGQNRPLSGGHCNSSIDG